MKLKDSEISSIVEKNLFKLFRAIGDKQNYEIMNMLPNSIIGLTKRQNTTKMSIYRRTNTLISAGLIRKTKHHLLTITPLGTKTLKFFETLKTETKKHLKEIILKR